MSQHNTNKTSFNIESFGELAMSLIIACTAVLGVLSLYTLPIV